MGQEQEKADRLKSFAGYQVDSKVCRVSNRRNIVPQAIELKTLQFAMDKKQVARIKPIHLLNCKFISYINDTVRACGKRLISQTSR